MRKAFAIAVTAADVLNEGGFAAVSTYAPVDGLGRSRSSREAAIRDYCSNDRFGSRVPVRNRRRQTFAMTLRINERAVSAVQLRPTIGPATERTSRKLLRGKSSD